MKWLESIESILLPANQRTFDSFLMKPFMNGRTGLKGLILKICDRAPVNSAIRDVRTQEIGALKDCSRLNAFGEKV